MSIFNAKVSAKCYLKTIVACENEISEAVTSDQSDARLPDMPTSTHFRYVTEVCNIVVKHQSQSLEASTALFHLRQRNVKPFRGDDSVNLIRYTINHDRSSVGLSSCNILITLICNHAYTCTH